MHRTRKDQSRELTRNWNRIEIYGNYKYRNKFFTCILWDVEAQLRVIGNWVTETMHDSPKPLADFPWYSSLCLKIGVPVPCFFEQSIWLCFFLCSSPVVAWSNRMMMASMLPLLFFTKSTITPEDPLTNSSIVLILKLRQILAPVLSFSLFLKLVFH